MTRPLTPADALDLAADIIDGNGYCCRYLWDTAQEAAGTPPEYCRVDIAGALAVALHGSPTHAASPRVRDLEALLTARVPAPSLAAWYSHPGIGRRDVLRLLRAAAVEARRDGAPS